MEELRKAKAECWWDLHKHFPRYQCRLAEIDVRLVDYIEDAISNEGSHANLYELLGIRKVLRLMDSYEVNVERVQLSIRAIEGVWDRHGRHVKGGLKFDTPRGNMHVRLMPYQVWCMFGIYGFTTHVDMMRHVDNLNLNDNVNLLPTEYVDEDGEVWDRRRLTTEAHIFQTRKSGKTEWGAAVDFTETCILGPMNAQALICTNSAEQSKIAYSSIKEFAYQIDPSCLNRLGGKFFKVNANGMMWQPGQKRKGEIKVLTAGGKASRRRDGLRASVVHADEHGGAPYINGASDMQSLVEVCWGSTGPRREKLLLHTTTAGLVNEGPYKNQLKAVEVLLLRELEFPLGEAHRTDDDKWFAFLLQLDPWEQGYDLEQLDNEELFKKVNRSIGTTIQPNYYRERLHDAKMSEDTRKEVLTKDFNIWPGSSVAEWIGADQIRALQIDRRIDDCTMEKGWEVYAAFDFSHGDDFDAVTFLAWNVNTGEYFADCDAWVNAEAFANSPYNPLYRLWQEQGWLHVSGRKLVEPAAPIRRVMELDEKGLTFKAFGYDAYQSKEPILLLKEWLFNTVGLDNKSINNIVRPVSQTFANYNASVQKVELGVNGEVKLRFSMSPLWPWEFQNCVLEEDTRMGNKKPLKRFASGKVDNVQCLCSCFNLEENQG